MVPEDLAVIDRRVSIRTTTVDVTDRIDVGHVCLHEIVDIDVPSRSHAQSCGRCVQPITIRDSTGSKKYV